MVTDSLFDEYYLCLLQLLALMSDHDDLWTEYGIHSWSLPHQDNVEIGLILIFFSCILLTFLLPLLSISVFSLSVCLSVFLLTVMRRG